jgi:serine/threonine protein kinase
MWALGVMAFRILMRTTLFSNVGEVIQYNNHPDLVLPRARLEDCDVNPDGAAFIRALLRPPPAERLTSNKALEHDWIRSLIPTALVTPAAPSE